MGDQVGWSIHHRVRSTPENQLATKRVLNIRDAKRVDKQACRGVRPVHSFCGRLPVECAVFSVSECGSGDLADESPSGDLRALGAHRGGDGAGAGRHVRLDGVAERFGQRVGSGRAGRVRGSNAEVVDSLCPVVLVIHLRHDDLGCSGLRGGSGGARAAMVYYSGDSPEERLQVYFPDGKAVGFIVREC